MSEKTPKISELKLNEQPPTPESGTSPATHSGDRDSSSSAPVTPSTPISKSAETAQKTDAGTAGHGGHEHDAHHNAGTPDSTATNSPRATPHLKATPSSSSISSQGSTSSTNKHSILELKRFFGKGRTKHEDGVSHSKLKEAHGRTPPQDAREAHHEKKHGFSLFGLGKRGKSPKSTPKSTPRATPRNSLTPVVSPHHHHHHQDTPEHKKTAQRPVVKRDPNQDLRNNIEEKYIDPRHLDPEHHQQEDLVVHDPGYEGDWDPFHVFGTQAANSQSLPFLESGITKYGQMGRDMGSGAGGSVRMMARPSDHKMFAVKEFRPRRQNETPQKYAKHVTAEYALGAALHHKNIIETIDLLKEGDRFYEIMEYGPHDYFELVMSCKMTTMQVNSAFKQIVSGVAYLHSMGVAHRDLKLDNCVVDNDGVVKLIDFGSSVIFKYPMSNQIHLARGICGSDPYLAPEVFLKKPYQPQIADIWSCGIIYCCSYLRRFPWKLPQESDVGYKKFVANPANVDGRHPVERNSKKIMGPWRLLRLLPIDTRDVIHRVLMVDVDARITTNELLHTHWLEGTMEVSVLPR